MAGITISFVRCIDNTGYEGMLDVGEIYQSLPTTEIEDAAGDLRIIDNEGEDYLYNLSLEYQGKSTLTTEKESAYHWQ